MIVVADAKCSANKCSYRAPMLFPSASSGSISGCVGVVVGALVVFGVATFPAILFLLLSAIIIQFFQIQFAMLYFNALLLPLELNCTPLSNGYRRITVDVFTRPSNEQKERQERIKGN